MNKLLKKIIKRQYYNSETYIKYLKNIGMRIGNRVKIFDPDNTFIDSTRPWLIDIGDNVMITRGVTILTHGYDWSVLDAKYFEVLGSSGKVKIGNNVFIGMNTTILKGVTIGNNVIIGAGSVVTHDIEDDCVVAGVPAKKIMDIEKYFYKRKNAQIKEAKELAVEYYKVYKKIPDKSVLYEFMWLFGERTKAKDDDLLNNLMNNRINKEKSWEMYMNTEPEYSNYEEFILDALKEYINK